MFVNDKREEMTHEENIIDKKIEQNLKK